jgi:hypothetical protein
MSKLLVHAVLVLGLFAIAAGPLALADEFKLIAPVEDQSLRFQDGTILVQFSLAREQGQYKRIAFALTNLSQEAVRIDWESSSIILPSGQASNVIHEGVRYINSDSYMAPTTLPTGSTVYDSVIPTDSLSYATSSGWKIRSMGLSSDAEFGLYLALVVDGAAVGYDFRFHVMDLQNLDPVARISIDGKSGDDSAHVVSPFGTEQWLGGWVVDFGGYGSSDADGSIVAYHWTFGDGALGTGARVRHVYDEPGSYDVGLTVMDDAGGTNSVIRKVVVSTEPSPLLQALPWILLAGVALGLAWLLGLKDY